MDDYTKRIAALSPEQRKLLELRMKKREPAESDLSSGTTQAPTTGNSALSQLGKQMRSKVDPSARKMQFSIFYFSDDGSIGGDDKYRLLFETAQFADEHGFAAIWVPERHFQDFGGLYPNPTVLAAALSRVTSSVQIRAGSIVLPLHNPIRVAEDWSVIDNLSHGRVAISFATGWHPADFVLAPGIYENRKEVMIQGINTIQSLWAGETLKLQDGSGAEVEVQIRPRPVQPKLPVWITTSGSPATWLKAGEMGVNVLAALIGQSMEELGKKIALYREALTQHGHGAEAGRVAIMLHTFLGESNEAVKELVREPLREYIATFIKQQEGASYEQASLDDAQGKKLKETLIDFAFERYFSAHSLLGTLPKCIGLLEQLQAIGVDEVACLIDFGLSIDTVMQGLALLEQLKAYYSDASLSDFESPLVDN